MSREFRYDHNGSVELLSFDVDFDSYPYLMNLFIEAIANDREFGFARIQVNASQTAPERDMSMVVKKQTIYVVAIHDGQLLHEIGYQEFGTRHFLKTRFTQFGETYKEMLGYGGSLIGLQVSRRLFHSSVMAVINNQGLSSEWKGSAGMFAYVVCEAARFFCIHKVLRIVFCLNTSITLANSYEWMANIPKLWWKFSKWHREILDETPAKEDMTNKATREFDKADFEGASPELKRWGREIIKFASWDKKRSRILPNKSNIAKIRKERREEWGQIKFRYEKETKVKRSGTYGERIEPRIEPSLKFKNNLGKNFIDFLLKVDNKNHPMLYLLKDTIIMAKSCGMFRGYLGSTQEIQGGGNGSNRGSHHHRTALGKLTPSKWDSITLENIWLG
ncbi:enhancer of polycomb-like protein [Tanacetum coccineum]